MEGETPAISITPPEPTGFPLTKEFLEIAFKREVDTFTAKLGTNPGDNYLSIIHAVDVKFKGEDREYNYLIKCYPNHPGRRQFLDQMNVFEKELFMYDDFLCQLKQLAVENEAEDACLSLAPYHGGNVVGSKITKTNDSFKDGPWENENFIIMTDLRKSGYKMVDRTKGLDVTHASLVMKEIAKMHATSWAYKQKNGLTLLTSKYDNLAEEVYSNSEMIAQFKPMMDKVSDSTVTLVEEALGTENPAAKNFRAFIASDVMAYMKDCLQREGIDELHQESYLRVKPGNNKDYISDPWLVCAHGDCWVNNILFKYDEQEPPKPVAVTLVDFQVAREACPTTDLVYFLFTSVRTPIRVSNEKELLQAYHDSFVQSCEALHVKPLPGFTLESLQRRFKRSKLFGLVLSLPLLNIVLKPHGESTDMDKHKGEKIEELFSSVLEGQDRNTNLRDEMTASILHLYEDGVL